MASCSGSSPAPNVHVPTVLIYFHNYPEATIKNSPSHQGESITKEEIECEDAVSEVSSAQTSSATPHANVSPRRTQEGTDLAQQCSDCGRVFITQGHLAVHQCSYAENRPYSCLWSEKSFAKPNNLRQHQRTHTGEKPHHCSQCGQRFSRHSHLKRHQRTHTGEKPFHCSDCGLSFTGQSDLRRHQRIQARKRPFQCSDCQHSYTRQTDLYRHQRIHTGEKTHRCSGWTGF